MSTRLSDYAEHTQARGAAVPSADEARSIGTVPNYPGADEAALVNVLRLLNRIGHPAPLAPVERAFVLGAKAMFVELMQICDHLLEPSKRAEVPTPPALPTPSPPVEKTSAAPATPRHRQRPTPGGGSPR